MAVCGGTPSCKPRPALLLRSSKARHWEPEVSLEQERPDAIQNFLLEQEGTSMGEAAWVGMLSWLGPGQAPEVLGRHLQAYKQRFRAVPQDQVFVSPNYMQV